MLKARYTHSIQQMQPNRHAKSQFSSLISPRASGLPPLLCSRLYIKAPVPDVCRRYLGYKFAVAVFFHATTVWTILCVPKVPPVARAQACARGSSVCGPSGFTLYAFALYESGGIDRKNLQPTSHGSVGVLLRSVSVRRMQSSLKSVRVPIREWVLLLW